MAPNLTGGRAPSEALDSFLARHESHDSLEVFRDDKENSKLFPIRETVPSRASHEGKIKIDSDDSEHKKSSKIPSHSDIVIERALPENAKPVESASLQFEHIRTGSGKSFSSNQDSVANLPSITKSTDPKILNQNSEANDTNPEEALLNHDPAVQEALKHQQEDLLELALKEDFSVTKEEEKWAMVEKRLTEDFSFAQAVEELLQRTIEDNEPSKISKSVDVSPIAAQLARIDSVAAIENQKENDEFYATSSGKPPKYEEQLDQNQKARPILSKRTTVSPRGLADNSKNTHIVSSSRVSLLPPFVSDNSNSKISQQEQISNTPTNPTPTLIQTESSTHPTKSKSTASSRRKSTKHSTSSTTPSPVSKGRPQVRSDLVAEPTTILHIPGHAPETPADIVLTHHEQSKEFLEGQGARVLNDAMSAEGATAVILSSMCLLFIALIGIAYFFKRQRKDKIMAKVAADIENQREKHLTTDGGLITYKLQPAPITSVKSIPSFSTFQQPSTEQTKSQTMTTKPKSSSSLYPSTIITNEKMSEKAAMAAKISEKSKMAASCSESSKMSAVPSNSSLPSYDEIQSFKSEVSFKPSGGQKNNKGKLWFSIAYDPIREALLLHVQQARYSQVRTAGRVWVEACLLTNRNEMHSTGKSDVTTATQSPVFNSRLAFQVAMGHLEGLLLRLTLYGGDVSETEDLTTLGSVIVPLASCNLSQKNPLIRDLY